MTDPYAILVWLRVAALLLVLVLLIVLVFAGAVAAVLAVRERKRSYVEFITQRGSLTHEQRERLRAAWAEAHADPDARHPS